MATLKFRLFLLTSFLRLPPLCLVPSTIYRQSPLSSTRWWGSTVWGHWLSIVGDNGWNTVSCPIFEAIWLVGMYGYREYISVDLSCQDISRLSTRYGSLYMFASVVDIDIYSFTFCIVFRCAHIFFYCQVTLRYCRRNSAGTESIASESGRDAGQCCGMTRKKAMRTFPGSMINSMFLPTVWHLLCGSTCADRHYTACIYTLKRLRSITCQ